MRIIYGKHKNKKIQTQLKGVKFVYRPTQDKIRQAIFNILDNWAKSSVNLNGVVADICCGSGSLGLEALSRGASKAYFIDKHSEQIYLAKLNAQYLNESNNCVFINSDAKKLRKAQEVCDIIFIDPPYNSNMMYEITTSLLDKGWVGKNSLVIIECGNKDDIAINPGFKVIEERLYGNTKLVFISI